MGSSGRLLTFLWLATLLFALGPAILKMLTTKGGSLGIAQPGAISFCNVLFVGNFCAGLVTLIVHGPGRVVRELSQLSPKTRRRLMLAAVFSTVYPALIFIALEQTSVINIVLLSRFNGIVIVALAFFVMRVPVRRAETYGYALIAAGVVALTVVNNRGLGIRTGDLLVLLAAVFFALTEFTTRSVLRECPIHAYVFFRNFVSAVIFFVIAVVLFGFEHFMDAFVGELWLLMVIYASVAVVAAQLLWLNSAPVLPVQTVAATHLLNPAFSILFAYWLVDEIPSGLEWAVMGVVALGMLVTRLPAARHGREPSQPSVLGLGLAGTH